MTNKEIKLVNALRFSYDYSSQRDKDAANMIEELCRSRDAWRHRAEAAEEELRGACWCCAKARTIKITPERVVYACNGLMEQADGYSEWKCKHWRLRKRCAKNRSECNASD